MLSFLTETTVNGFPLWVILLICVGVFMASFMDAIAGGGGIISVPVYLMALGNVPTYYILGTNKISAGIGTFFSTARFVKNGLVDWKLCLPGAALSMLGSVCGTWLQLHTPDVILKYLLLVVLPIIAFVTLRGRSWPDEAEPRPYRTRLLIVCIAAIIIGCYDGYYGPGTGTFLMLILVRIAHMDTRHAAGCTKVINLASNIGGMTSALIAGYAFPAVGLIAACASVLGHWLGAGLAIKNGSRIVRPAVITVLLLLTAKIGSELLFPEFWN
jgi:uncharacterized membrane protein YfcA